MWGNYAFARSLKRHNHLQPGNSRYVCCHQSIVNPIRQETSSGQNKILVITKTCAWSSGLKYPEASKTTFTKYCLIRPQTLSSANLPNGLSPHKTVHIHNTHCSEFWRATPRAATPSLCGPPCGPHCGASVPTLCS